MWRVCALTVIVCKHQQGEFLQSLCELIVPSRMLSSPVSDEDQRPGERKEGRTYEEVPNVCVFIRGNKICAKTHGCSTEMVKKFWVEQRAFSRLNIKNLPDVCWRKFAQMAHAVSRSQFRDHALQTPWMLGGRRTDALLGIPPWGCRAGETHVLQQSCSWAW